MRRRNTLIEPLQSAEFEDMEFVLFRCPPFFAKENVATVFPDAARFVSAVETESRSDGSPVVAAHYYLLYTFQPSDFVMERASDEDSEMQGLSSCDEYSPSPPALIVSPNMETNGEEVVTVPSPTPPVLEWRDRSRERVYKFMTIAKRRIAESLSRNGETEDGSTVFFMDWPDPATGLPACSRRGSTTFSDADTVEQFFSFRKTMVAGPGGGCYMVEHPRFGLSVYLDAAVIAAPTALEGRLCEAVRGLGVSAKTR